MQTIEINKNQNCRIRFIRRLFAPSFSWRIVHRMMFLLLMITAYANISAQEGTSRSPISIIGPSCVCRPFVGENDPEKIQVEFYAVGGEDAIAFQWSIDNKEIGLLSSKDNPAKCTLILSDDPYGETEIHIRASQSVGGKMQSATHTLFIEGGYYYFYPDCSNLYEKGLISKEEYEQCDEEEWECQEMLFASPCNYIIDVEFKEEALFELLFSNSELADPESRLRLEPIMKLYKMLNENGQPYRHDDKIQLRDFVKPFPCMERWASITASSETEATDYECPLAYETNISAKDFAKEFIKLFYTRHTCFLQAGMGPEAYENLPESSRQQSLQMLELLTHKANTQYGGFNKILEIRQVATQSGTYHFEILVEYNSGKTEEFEEVLISKKGEYWRGEMSLRPM